MSELLIGNDSGPAHFAALTDISILTLYGPETPALYGPLSSRAENVFLDMPAVPAFPRRTTGIVCAATVNV